MKQILIKMLFKLGVVTSISTLRKNENGYWFLTFLGKNGNANNVYFGKKSSDIISAKYKQGDNVLAELKTAPQGMTVYLCLPANRMKRCNRWLRMFINLLLDAMEREKTKPALPVLACLDEFPVLGQDFVEYILHQVQPQFDTKTPSIAVTEEVFKRMGSRPEELMKVLKFLRTLPQGADADEYLPAIAQSLGAAAADVELQKMKALGPLAEAVFSRICSIGGNVKFGLTADALKEYSVKTGREFTAQECKALSA